MDKRFLETEYKVCPISGRKDIDYDHVYMDENNPRDFLDRPKYPIKISSTEGSSTIIQISDKYFFKRKLQDFSAAGVVLSLHHDNSSLNELFGSFDDIAEVFCWLFSKHLINPKTGEPIFKVAEYTLARYRNEKEQQMNGCLSKNVCEKPNEKLISLATICKSYGYKGKKITEYMNAIRKYFNNSIYDIDFDEIEHDIKLNSSFCWKVGNSDNHKNNITIITTRETGRITARVSPMIDNGSAFEFSSAHILPGSTKSVIENRLEDDNFSEVDKEGERYFYLKQPPQKNNAIYLDRDSLLFDSDVDLPYLNYEYPLVSDMLSSERLFDEIYQMECQYKNALDLAFEDMDKIYGTINWPPHTKDFMYALLDYKSRTLSEVMGDYFAFAASECIKPKKRQDKNIISAFLREQMSKLPLLASKKEYEMALLALARENGLEVDEEKLSALKFKKEGQPEKNEQQPS